MSKSIYGKTRQDVARELTAMLHARDQGLPVGFDERQTVEQYLLHWLDEIQAQALLAAARGNRLEALYA